MKHIFLGVCLLVFSFSINISFVQATSQADLQKQIEALLEAIRKIESKSKQSPDNTPVLTTNPNLVINSIDDGKSGKPRITITAPTRKKSTFRKDESKNPIIISWKAFNVPVSTNLTIDLSNVKIEGPVGGGSAQFALPQGDSTGTYKWDIYGEGRVSAGTYRVQLGLEECSKKGCANNPHFPGQEENVRLYAQSKSVGVTIVGSSPVSSPTKRAVITTIDDLDAANPTVTGTTLPGTSSVGFSISQGDLIYGSGPITVLNNRWSHTISEDLRPGRYTITLYVNNVKADERIFRVQ